MSFWSWVGDWVKSVRVKARYLFGVWLLGVLVLGLPEAATSFLGLYTFRTSYRGYVGFAVLLAFVFWLIALYPWFEAWRGGRRVLQNLNHLSTEEKEIFAICLLNGQRTIYRAVGNPGAMALCNKGLLRQAGGALDGLKMPFTVPAFVWKHLQEDSSGVGDLEEWKKALKKR